MSAVIAAGVFMCAAFIEWVKNSYAPFSGLVYFKWTTGLRNFLYLMTMFNILLVRYAVLKIYTAPGHIDFAAVAGRLYRAAAASMLLSGLPCIYGVVLFLICGDPVDFYLLFGLSVLYGLIFMPRFGNWVSVAEEKAAPQ